MNFFDYKGQPLKKENIRSYSYDNDQQKIVIFLEDGSSTYIKNATQNLYKRFDEQMR